MQRQLPLRLKIWGSFDGSLMKNLEHLRPNESMGGATPAQRQAHLHADFGPGHGLAAAWARNHSSLLAHDRSEVSLSESQPRPQ